METQQIDLDLEVLGSYFADDADAPATWEEALHARCGVRGARLRYP